MLFKSKLLKFTRLFLLFFLINLYAPTYSQIVEIESNIPSSSYLRKKPKNNFYF